MPLARNGTREALDQINAGVSVQFIDGCFQGHPVIAQRHRPLQVLLGFLVPVQECIGLGPAGMGQLGAWVQANGLVIVLNGPLVMA